MRAASQCCEKAKQWGRGRERERVRERKNPLQYYITQSRTTTRGGHGTSTVSLLLPSTVTFSAADTLFESGQAEMDDHRRGEKQPLILFSRSADAVKEKKKRKERFKKKSDFMASVNREKWFTRSNGEVCATRRILRQVEAQLRSPLRKAHGGVYAAERPLCPWNMSLFYTTNQRKRWMSKCLRLKEPEETHSRTLGGLGSSVCTLLYYIQCVLE